MRPPSKVSVVVSVILSASPASSATPFARGSLRANGVALDAGDALKITDTTTLTLDGGRNAEVLVFDLPGGR